MSAKTAKNPTRRHELISFAKQKGIKGTAKMNLDELSDALKSCGTNLSIREEELCNSITKTIKIERRDFEKSDELVIINDEDNIYVKNSYTYGIHRILNTNNLILYRAIFNPIATKNEKRYDFLFFCDKGGNFKLTLNYNLINNEINSSFSISENISTQCADLYCREKDGSYKLLENSLKPKEEEIVAFKIYDDYVECQYFKIRLLQNNEIIPKSEIGTLISINHNKFQTEDTDLVKFFKEEDIKNNIEIRLYDILKNMHPSLIVKFSEQLFIAIPEKFINSNDLDKNELSNYIISKYLEKSNEIRKKDYAKYLDNKIKEEEEWGVHILHSGNKTNVIKFAAKKGINIDRKTSSNMNIYELRLFVQKEVNKIKNLKNCEDIREVEILHN